MTELDTGEYQPAQEQEEEEEVDDVEAKQVEEFLKHLNHVLNRCKKTQLQHRLEELRNDIKENGNITENITIKKFQCLKCNEVFDTKRSYQGHYHGNPGCGDTPRWMSEYDNPEQQLNTIKV